MSRRCENCVAWTSSDSVWGECWRSMDEDARMGLRAPEYGRPDPLETKFNFGCVEWRSTTKAA